jgi:hypothetical protein
MTTQLQLIEGPAEAWQLDAVTRDIGRRGVAQARSALLAARLRAATGDDHAGGHASDHGVTRADAA